MTAKHRKGKSNHKQENNFFKNEILEAEGRPGGNNHAPLLVLVVIIVIGFITCAWLIFQQHLTLTELTDNVMGVQVKISKLQSLQEELRLSNTKQQVSGNVETRLASLEESSALAQKQVGLALATAEQLKTSDFPAQVLSLHTEMKTRLVEVQQATVSLEQLSQLRSMLMGKSMEFEDLRMQVVGLAALSGELSRKVEDLSLNLAESKMEEKIGQIATMSATQDGQTSEMLKLKNQLDTYQTQLQSSLLETAHLRGLFENKEAQLFLKSSDLGKVVNEMQPPAEHLKNMEADAADEEVTDDEKEWAATDEADEEVVIEMQPPAEHLKNMEPDAADEEVTDDEKELAATDEADEEVDLTAVKENVKDATVTTEEKQVGTGNEEQSQITDMSEKEEEEEASEPDEEREVAEREEEDDEETEPDTEEEATERDEEEDALELDEGEELSAETDMEEEEAEDPEGQEDEEEPEEADGTKIEDQAAAGTEKEEAPTAQKGESVPGEEDTGKTEEALSVTDDEQEQKKSETSLHKEEYVGADEKDAEEEGNDIAQET